MKESLSLSAMCANEACPMASQCMRYTKYTEVRETELSLRLLNISLVNVTANGCEYLHVPQQVTLARGFRGMYESLPQKAARNLWQSFPCCNSRRQFYYMLSGDVPLYPEQQQKILDFFSERGADTSLGFDAYQEVVV